MLGHSHLHSCSLKTVAFAHKQTPHKVFLLPDYAFYLSVNYLSSENLNEISWHVFEGVFLFSNVLIAAMQVYERKVS